MTRCLEPISLAVQVEILKHIDLNNGRMETRLESFEKKTKAAMFNFNQVAKNLIFYLHIGNHHHVHHFNYVHHVHCVDHVQLHPASQLLSNHL